jgi:hypothetical protein
MLLFVLIVSYSLQKTVMDSVIDGKNDNQVQIVNFLNRNIDKSEVIETWEHELMVMTNHNYHAPDQSLLIQTHAAINRGGTRDYTLGEEYFQLYHPKYLVVGWFARWLGTYDDQFLATHSCLLTTIGQDVFRYDIYKLSTNSTVLSSEAEGIPRCS